MEHQFSGQWITDREFATLASRNVFHKQLERVELPCDEHRNRHILFRRSFQLTHKPSTAIMYITADDYYKLYINGRFVAQGPAPSYPQRMRYNAVDVTDYLTAGHNVVAVHTLYKGLINRVWVSGDGRHGLLCDLVADGETLLASDECFLTHPHTGYTETGTSGYQTQFLETYDSAAPEVGFEAIDFDDSAWAHACVKQTDYTLAPQETKMLDFETIRPAEVIERGVPDDASKKSIYIDFGKCYVGYLSVTASGRVGDTVTVRCAQELSDEEQKILRYQMRCNCVYDEAWLLSGRPDDTLSWFDYKAFRYAELIVPQTCVVSDIVLIARHYPFTLNAKLKPEFAGDEALERVWALCVHSQRYGVQEVIQDCMDREKGFYVGDGCYTALAHMILSGDDSMSRKLIDDAFLSTFITDGMVTCLNCSFMQEIAEYPLMLVSLILWHYRVTDDKAYLAKNYPGARALLEAYRRDYEREGLLRDLDKWCVVEWPANYRDGYDVDIAEGKVCHEPHIAINAYYIEAVRCVNAIARILGEPAYRDETPLIQAFMRAFYDEKRHLFTDSLTSNHISYVGNIFPFAFGLVPDAQCEENMLAMIRERGIEGVNFFCGFPMLVVLTRRGEKALLRRQLSSPNAWLRMLREGATSTYEAWGRDCKWNTSLFHLMFTFAAIFLAEGTEDIFAL